jgi:hypothetical protein
MHCTDGERGMAAEQIRHRSGFLDDNNDPYIPVATIRNWLGEEGAGVAPRQASIPPTPRAVTPLDRIQQLEDHPALHDEVARLEALLQVDRLSTNLRYHNEAQAPHKHAILLLIFFRS